MEELLNKLIKTGWKPRGIYTSLIGGYGLVRCEEYVGSPNNERKSYRELVSKESGLWQFVCENGMVNCDNKNDINSANQKVWHITDYQYRIIESALCNEEDLDKFLLENIKIS